MGSSRTAGPTLYIQEELSDARLRLDELKGYVIKAYDMLDSLEQKDQIYAAAGEIIYAIPDCLFKIEKALGAVSMAMNKVDYEEQRQILRPEKVDELERVLDELRLNMPRRNSRGLPTLTPPTVDSVEDVSE